MTLSLRPYQQALADDVRAEWAAGRRNVLMRLDTGGGKCLGRGTPVLMFDGSVRAVETVRKGSLIMGPDSRPRRVLSTCRGVEPLYRIVPTKGDPYVVNESHILSLQRAREVANPRYPSQRRGGEIVNISVREYLTKSTRWKHLHKGWRTGVSFPRRSLPRAMPAYLLGVWLGDGSSRGPAITTADPEILEYIERHAGRFGLSLHRSPPTGAAYTYTFSSGRGAGKKHRRNPVRNALTDLGLIENKHVPPAYKSASRKQRLDVLAGLMDTDGSYTGKGFDYISVRRMLAEDVCYLARSLGLAAYLAPCQKSYNGRPSEEYFRVSISGDVDVIPCRIARKRAAPRQQKKSVLRTGIRVEPIGDGEYFGFTLGGDGLFLLGDFTVTHNTMILSDIVRQHQGASAVIAHRQELVSQLSLALARNGVRHRLIAAKPTIAAICQEHVATLGASWYDPGARCAVASVDTLIRAKGLESWAAQVTLWVTDEGHHVVDGNKWHSALQTFTNPAVRGLLPTATPARADGQGLGRHADGVADVMVQGPPMRWLIEQGYLTDYRVVCPESDMRLLDDEIGSSGDWSTAKLRAAAKASHIVGDVVSSYQRWASGRLGVTFCPDTETAAEIAQAYNAAGVRAGLLTGKTDGGVRRSLLRQFAAREIMQLVVVDIVSEGFDLPAIEVGSFARKTASLATYMQQFGRVLRPMAGKPSALIIDHVGNFLRHGPPDRPRDWTLDRRERRSGPSTGIPMRVCLACYQPYERVRSACPYCETPAPPPAIRSSPAAVEGDLAELDPDVLAKLRGEVERTDMTTPDYGRWLASRRVEGPAYHGAVARHHAKQGAQAALREAMTEWVRDALARGYSDRETHRLFWATWGVDVLSARALPPAEADALRAKIIG